MKIAASALSLSILLSAPGIAPYAAAARVVRGAAPGATPSRGVPALPPALPGRLPALPTLPHLPAAPGAAALPPAAQAQPVQNPALAAGQRLEAKLAAAGSDGARQEKALSEFWSGERAAGEASIAVDGAAPGGERPALAPPSARPVSPESHPKESPLGHPQYFPKRSSREGIGPLMFLYWNGLYRIAQWFNLKLAKDPNRRVSWDKWPTELGLLYLVSKMRFLRAGTLTDPYDYASNDVKPAGREPDAAKTGYTADGSWVSDRENPRMGAENTRFGSNIPPKKVRPDVENMTPSAREVGKLKWRKLDENGKPIVQPALILNNLAGGWIQFQFHNFGGNTKRDPIEQNPHKLPRGPQDNWPEKEAVVDRTTQDPTRVTDNGRPTIINERTQAWIQAQIYGTNAAELAPLRSYQDGKMRLDEKGMLPEDPSKPGIDLSGFVNNYNPLLSFLHWAFVVNHNKIAEHLKSFNPSWDDETLFQQARKINVAEIDMIHTVEWTEDLLQHPTLQKGMHADAYGLLGPRLKAYLMRAAYRHGWARALVSVLRRNDVIWGMPGSKWEHHDGPFQVPKHFRMVYRLHEMILDEQEIMQPGTDRTLDRIGLIDFVHHNTRPIVEKFGYDVLAYSFARKSAGALKLHNFPRALSQFQNQQNGRLTDLAELDIFRERTDGTGTYNEFRRSVGEPPVKTFLELTGGDAELAKELEIKYEGDIEKVDAGIGILAEPKPDGFALSFTQFYQFVLNAPRRFKSNRHLTDSFSHRDYSFEGMEWVLNAGGMGGVIARAVKDLPHGKAVVASMEGVTRWFAPWPDTETFPVRLLDAAQESSGKLLKAELRMAALASFAALSAWMAVAVSSFTPAAWVTALVAAPVILYYKRMLAWRFMQKTWQSAYTDRRRSMFPTLFLGEKWARRAAAASSLIGSGVLLGGGLAAWAAFGAGHPFVAAFAGVAALSAVFARKAASAYAGEQRILKIALQSRLREGYEPAGGDGSKIPGKTALEKRYWFLVRPGSSQPVARPLHTYRALHEHGLGRLAAAKTAVLSHLLFGPRTQRGLGIKGRWKAGVLFNPFAIYVPNLIQAQGPLSWRIYAPKGNAKGLTPGDVDMEEFDRMFRMWAPGRDYMTGYDFARMREYMRWQAAREGRAGVLRRWIGSFMIKHRTDQFLQLYADRVVNEDKKLVPAISREMLLRFYQGTAQADILAERALDGVHPDLKAPEPLDEQGRAPFWRRAKAAAKRDAKAFFGSVRRLASGLVLPLSLQALKTNARAFGRFFSEVKQLGWKVVAGVFLYYLVRDTILYILIPLYVLSRFVD